MAEAAAQITIAPELEAQLKAFGIKAYNDYMADATPEQKAAGEARAEQYKNDPSYAQNHMERIQREFGECDANGDGRLDLEEYRAFI